MAQQPSMIKFQRELRQRQEHNDAVPVMSAMLHDYWMMRRRNIIAELRLIDDLLGLEQTIPRRSR